MAIGGWGYIQIFEIEKPQTYLKIIKVHATVMKMLTIFDHTILLCAESKGYVELIDLQKGIKAKCLQIEDCTQINDVAQINQNDFLLATKQGLY
jgi:hypothetical protein